MKKCFALLLALLFAAAANLHLCVRLSAPDGALSEWYTPACLGRGQLAWRAAAEELLPDTARWPKTSPRLALSLRPPGRDPPAASDWLLLQTEGIARMDGLYANGVFLGCTEDRQALKNALQQQLSLARPPGAVSGRYTEQLALRTVYSRTDCAISTEDLCLLVGGLVPVIYCDRAGRVLA